MGDVPEQVYLDAARAALGVPDDFDSPTLRVRAAHDWHRRTVASAYRAGQAATPDGPRRWAPILAEISDERERQVAKWGEQNHPDGTGRPGDAETAMLDRAKCKANVPDEDNFRDILQEEVSEAFAETDPRALRGELVQVAAVAVQWIQEIDRRALTDATPAADGQDGDGRG